MELHCCGLFPLDLVYGLQMAELGMKVAMLYYGRLFIQYGQMSTGNLVSFILYQQDLGDNIRVCLCLLREIFVVTQRVKLFHLNQQSSQKHI